MSLYSYLFARNVGRQLRNIVDSLNTVVEKTDEVLYSYASRKMDDIYDVREAAAMNNAEYAEIEARRNVDGNGSIIFTSDEHDLFFEDWERQIEIRDEISPEPQVMKLYRWLYGSPLSGGLNSVRLAFQRLTRSWDDSSTWSLDYHLTLTLGAQLKHLAETTHGWPESEKFPTFEDWQKALNVNGDFLLAYSTKDDIVFNTDKPYDKDREEQIIKDAQSALIWVADNLPALWD